MARIAKSRLDKTLPEVMGWANDNMPISGRRLQDYESGSGSVGLANIDLFQYGMLAVSESLAAAHDRQASEANRLMSHGISRMLYAELIDLRDMKGSDQVLTDTLDGCAHLMLGAIALGAPHLVQPFFKEVLSGIEDGYGVRDGHDRPFSTTLRYAGFSLSIVADWLGQQLDMDKHALPRDPAWGTLVANWREPAPEELLPVLLTACDTHVERIAVTYSEANTYSEKFEFNSVFLAVHPTEILAVLRLRDLLGLPNPAKIDHPLMQTPYAAITCKPGVVTERDELLDRFLTVVRQRDPQVLPPGL